MIGKEIPNEVFIVKDGNKFKLKSLTDNVFEFQFKHVSSDIKFQFFAGGYTSKHYLVKCLMQPKIVNLEIVVTPPKYTGKKINTINSGGDLIIFEGSSVKWNVLFNNSHQNTFILEDKIIAESNENQLQLEKKIVSNSKYAITTI